MLIPKIRYRDIKSDPIASYERGRPDVFRSFVEQNNVLLWKLYATNTKIPAPYYDHGRSYRILHNAVRRQIDVFHEYVGFERERWDDICKRTQEWAKRNNKVAEIYDGSHSWCYHSEDGTGTAVIIVHDPDVHVKMP